MAFDSSNDSPGGLYVKAMEATRRYVAGIRDDQWHDATPCTEWDVRELMRHVVYEIAWIEDMFAGQTVEEVGDRYDGDILGSDPLAAYDAAHRSAKAAVEAPGAMDTICHLRRRDVTGAAYAANMLIDVFIHGWDIAKATGQDTTLDPELVEASYKIVEPRKGQPQSGRAFGPQIEMSEAVDLQTKMLGILGRRA
jgi:uncharacterized protein (TIGR03086 family)